MKYQITVIKISDSGKSAFCRVTTGVTGVSWVRNEVGIGYLYFQEGIAEEDKPKVGDSFPYEGTVEFEVLIDSETGEVRTTSEENGSVPLHRIVLK